MNFHDCPMIQAVLLRNQAFIEGDWLIGKAADGAEVRLGDVSDRAQCTRTEQYLRDYPTPQTW